MKFNCIKILKKFISVFCIFFVLITTCLGTSVVKVNDDLTPDFVNIENLNKYLVKKHLINAMINSKTFDEDILRFLVCHVNDLKFISVGPIICLPSIKSFICSVGICIGSRQFEISMQGNEQQYLSLSQAAKLPCSRRVVKKKKLNFRN